MSTNLMTRRIYYSEWAHLTQLGFPIKEQVCVPLLCRLSCPMLGTPRIVVLCGTTISSCLGNLCRLVVSDVWHIADNCVVQNYCSKQYTVTLCYLCRLSCPMFGIPRIIVLCGTTAYQAMWPWAMLTVFFIGEHRKITNCLSLLEGG